MKTTALKCLLLILLATTLSACKKQVAPSYHDKIWLHRANQVEKAQHFQYEYAGMEIDVRYSDSLGTLLVMHDANEASPISLDQWCKAVNNVSNLGLWFDFKNLKHHNRDAALECFVALREKHRLKGKLIVESTEFNELGAFHDAGFLVSYYIPVFNPDTDDSATFCKHLPKIHKAIASGVDAISGYDYQYGFMKEHFPQQPKLIWTIREEPDYEAQLIGNIGCDSLVEVLLLPNNTLIR